MRYGANHHHTVQQGTIPNQEATDYKKQNWGQWAYQQLLLERCSFQVLSSEGRKGAGNGWKTLQERALPRAVSETFLLSSPSRVLLPC